MGRWRDVTIGDLYAGVVRYRPLYLVVLGVALLSTLTPGMDRNDTSGELAAAPSPLDPTDDGASDATTRAEREAAARAAEVEGIARDDGLPAAQAELPPALRAAQTDPLQAPDCDPKTGRLAVPWTAQSHKILVPPNCIPLWPKADNGGATHRGVTADTITMTVYIPPPNAAIAAAVGVPTAGQQDSEEARRERAERRKLALDAFHAHYETYGRRVEVVEVEASGDVTDDAAARADAVRIATEIRAFVNFNDPSMAGGVATFAEELARRGVLCIGCTPAFPEWNPRVQEWAPYVISIRPGPAGIFDNAIEHMGKHLVGRPAEHAGDPLLTTRERVFGLIYYNTADGAYNGADKYLDNGLGRYGSRLESVMEQTLDVQSGQEQSRTIIARMKDAGVTTVLCWCDPIMPIFFTSEATRQNYFPEWFSPGSYLIDEPFLARLYDQVQWANAWVLGIPAAPVDPDSPDNPGLDIVRWHHDLPNLQHVGMNEFTALGIIFGAIHLAGPKLTSDTFRDALFSLKPASGYITRPAVSFGRELPAVPGVNDLNFMDDVTLAWWDPSERYRDETGWYRYVDMGRRYQPGTWPADVRLFDRQDTVVAHDRYPEQDRIPEYPNREGYRKLD